MSQFGEYRRTLSAGDIQTNKTASEGGLSGYDKSSSSDIKIDVSKDIVPTLIDSIALA